MEINIKTTVEFKINTSMEVDQFIDKHKVLAIFNNIRNKAIKTIKPIN